MQFSEPAQERNMKMEKKQTTKKHLIAPKRLLKVQLDQRQLSFSYLLYQHKLMHQVLHYFKTEISDWPLQTETLNGLTLSQPRTVEFKRLAYDLSYFKNYLSGASMCQALPQAIRIKGEQNKVPDHWNVPQPQQNEGNTIYFIKLFLGLHELMY